MSIAKKGLKNTYLKLSTGGENITFAPSISQDFFSLALKNKIALELAVNYENSDESIIIESFPDANGKNNLIDTTNSTALYNSSVYSYSYNTTGPAEKGLVQTVQLTSSSNKLEKILISEVFSGNALFPKSRVEVSLNNGLNYAFQDPLDYKYTDQLIDVSNLTLSAGNLAKLKLKLYIDSSLVLPASINTWADSEYNLWAKDNNVCDRTSNFVLFHPTSNYTILFKTSYETPAAGWNYNKPEFLQVVNVISGAKTYASGSMPASNVTETSFGFAGKDFAQFWQSYGTRALNQVGINTSCSRSDFKRFTYLTATWSTDTSLCASGGENYMAHSGRAGDQNNGIVLKGGSRFYGTKDEGTGLKIADPNQPYPGPYSESTQIMPASTTSWKYNNGVWSSLTNIDGLNSYCGNVHSLSNTHFNKVGHAYSAGSLGSKSTSYVHNFWNGTAWGSKASVPAGWVNVEDACLLTGDSNSLYYQGRIGVDSAYKYSKIVDSWAVLTSAGQIGFGSNWVAPKWTFAITQGYLWLSSNAGYGGLYAGKKLTFYNYFGLKGIGIKLIYS